jgi:GMP reductase
MLLTNVRYGYNDVMIQPCGVSNIEHRSHCNPFIGKVSYPTEEYDMLPIFAAPMSTVVDLDNYDTFYKNHIYAIIPRNIEWETRKKHIKCGDWVAVSLKEFEEYICNPTHFEEVQKPYTLRILIDVANGNMSKILELSKKAKEFYGEHIVLMAGNIANVDTYYEYCECGIDYCRVSIGTGCGCITASNTSIGDGIVSLIDDIYAIKRLREIRNKFCTKIIADGGVRNFSDVIKALSLGADYVMIGGLLSSCIESAGDIYEKDLVGRHIKIDKSSIKRENGNFVSYDGPYGDKVTHYFMYKEFYGMASKYGQIAINGEKTKTSEGIKKEILITTDLPTWTDNMCAYLRSAMSYCGIKDVKDFNPQNVTVQVISNNVKDSINK